MGRRGEWGTIVVVILWCWDRSLWCLPSAGCLLIVRDWGLMFKEALLLSLSDFSRSLCIL